jgi:hypothetical protein
MAKLGEENNWTDDTMSEWANESLRRGKRYRR